MRIGKLVVTGIKKVVEDFGSEDGCLVYAHFRNRWVYRRVRVESEELSPTLTMTRTEVGPILGAISDQEMHEKLNLIGQGTRYYIEVHHETINIRRC